MKNKSRPDPDELLSQIQKTKSKRGKLKIFFGMSAGVGKTYAMLKEAKILINRGEKVVISWLQSHGRIETDSLASGIETLPPKTMEYRGIPLSEMDLDALLKKKPAYAMIDELAHTNAPGVKHPKRYQDVLDVLEAGISVYTTVNIQHLESIADLVEEMTGIRITERIPDSIFDQADDVQLVDIPPEELITRLEEGKVYTGDKSREALLHFFKKENLAMLRELSLRHTAKLASHQLTNILRGESYSLSIDPNQRILVAISPSPNSEYLIRWARRFAYNLKAEWTCIHIESGQTLSDSEKDGLARNITLARNLGASVVTFRNKDVDEAIVRYAAQNSISLIIIGKSGIAAGRILFMKTSLSERIIRKAGKISVIAVQEKEIPPGIEKRILKKFEHSPRWQYGLTALSLACITAFNYWITPYTGYMSASIFYLGFISLAALKLDRLPVLFSACLSALLWNYIFIPPRFTFTIHRVEDLLMFFLFFLIAITSGWMTARMKSNEKMLERKEQSMSLLHELSSAMESVNGVSNAVRTGMTHIARAFRCSVLIFLKKENSTELSFFSDLDDSTPPDEKIISAASYCFSSGQPTGRFTTTLPLIPYHFIPMAAPGGTIGVIGIKRNNDTAWTEDEESFLLTLSSTVSLAVEREILAEKDKINIVVRESERLSRILLHSISHELRTPLSVIQGCASALIDADTADDPRARGQLIEEILSGTEKLNSIVENLLSMNRLETGSLKLKNTEVDPEEIISLALKQSCKKLETRPITRIIPENLPSIFCDPLLIIQVLCNILENAVQYSNDNSPLEVRIEKIDNALKFIILDTGTGVEEQELPHLFEKFFRGKKAKKGGTGLGLSICKGIIEAHGGTITAKIRNPQGLCVEFILPLIPQGTPNT